MSAVHEDLRTVIVHDRDFQKLSIDSRIYCVPVDEAEEERLETQHDIFFRLFGRRLYFPRVSSPRKILECGYGRGDWALAAAEEFEDCEITGIDIYPTSLADQPPNLTLFGYNLNDRLNDPEVFQRNAYDIIHSRCVAPGIKTNRWASYIRDMKMLLRPNGWVQLTEYYPSIQSWNGRLTTEASVYRWSQEYVNALERLNRNPKVGRVLQQYLSDAGLRDVGGTVLYIPIGAWDPDPVRAAIGRDSIDMISELLDSFSIWPFTARLGWTAAQVRTLTQAAQRELRDQSLKLYIPLYVAWGRRSSRA